MKLPPPILIAVLAALSASAQTPAPSTTPETPPQAEPSASPSPEGTSPEASEAPEAPESPEASTAPPSVLQQRIVSLRLLLADPEEGELERLEAYLSDVLGAEAGPALVTDVSRRLDLLGRYGAPLCRTERITADTASLSCTVRRARVLRRVHYQSNEVSLVEGVATGLPYPILESELRKRILLRPGEPIDDDDALGRGRIARQRVRIEDFLEREGYYGAQVIVDVGEANEAGEVDVDVRVRGGSFVKVRRVDVSSFGPFSQNRLKSAFGAMCWSPQGLIDGVFLWNITNCFTKRRLQDTVDAFDAELQALGYPEGRVRVTPRFIDARATNDVDNCAFSSTQVREFTAQKLPIPPRCVDLEVDVVAGRNVVTRFHLEDGEIAREWPVFDGTAQWIRETFGEPLSRTRQITFENPLSTSTDTVIVESELRSRLTFNEAASVDETEARLSEEHILEYMSARGYPSPQSKVSYVQYADGNVAVDYYLTAGQALPVRHVRLLGAQHKTTDEILEELELAARPRGLSSSGFVTIRDLEDDVVRLRSWYALQGFPEADVSVYATRNSADELEVVFNITEGERFVLAELVMAGGDPELTPKILKSIAHCSGRRDPPPLAGADCAGTPLLPNEFDADARRVESIYAGNGYPDAVASVELGFSEAGPIVRVAVFPNDSSGEARTNPKIGNVKALKLGEIFVEGNLKTSRDVLLREMGLDSAVRGSRLNPDQIAKGVSRLRRTSLYSRVDAQLVGLEDNDDTAHVRVMVEERATATVDLSLGFSTQQLASLRLEARERNLLGTMFDGSVNVDAGLFIGRASQVRNQIRWPRMFGSDFTLSYTPLSLTATDQPAGLVLLAPSTGGGRRARASWVQPDFRRRLVSVGTAVGLDWRATGISPLIDERLTIGVAVEARADWLQVKGPYFEPLTAASFESFDGMRTVFEGVDAVTPTNVFALTPRLAYSNIDNPFDPTSGFATEIFVRGVPLATTPYAVVGVAGRGYMSFFKNRVTLATNVRARSGFIGNSDACPPEEPNCEWAFMQNDLLNLGGERSVRGTKENQVGEQGVSLGQDLKVSVDEEGQPINTARQGLFGVGANVELRFTLIRQLFLGDLKPAVFADVAYSGDDFGASKAESIFLDSRYAVSVGTGLRYVLPVGPLAVDVAWSPFDVEQNPYRVSLTLGYIF